MKRQPPFIRLITVLMGITLIGAACTPASTVTPTSAPTAVLEPTATSIPIPTTLPVPTATAAPSSGPSNALVMAATYDAATRAAAGPTPTNIPFLLSKPPDLILAADRPVRQTVLPQHLKYLLPDMDRVLLASELMFWSKGNVHLLTDIYYPPDYDFTAKLPVVILVHDSLDATESKDFQEQIDAAELLALSGLIAVSAQAGPSPYLSFDYLLEYLNTNADQLGIDMSRIGFFGTSYDVAPAASHGFEDSPYRDSFKAAAFLCPQLGGVPKSWPENLSLFIVGANSDEYISVATTLGYVSAALTNNVPVEYITVPYAKHRFYIYQDLQASQDVIQQMLEFLKNQLLISD